MGEIGKMHCFLGFEFEGLLDLFEFVFGEFEMAAVKPSFVERFEVDVGVRDVGADNFPEDASAEDLLHMFGEFFHGAHQGLVVRVF